MRKVLVQYKVKTDKAAENEAHIRKVFDELKRTQPVGLRYASFKLDDGVSFIHLAVIDTPDGDNPLTDSAAFKAFQAEIKDRCVEPPIALDLNEIGAYNM